MRFKTLLSDAGVMPLSCHGDAEIARVCQDSRESDSGSCFVAISGSDQNGHDYISTLGTNVGAIVCEDPVDIPEMTPYAVVENTRAVLGPLAQAIRSWPCRKLTSTAVTGTNGKTTVAYLVRNILRDQGINAAMLGTVIYDTFGETSRASKTTPGAVELAELTDQMVHSGADHLVMELSSHGLDQGRAAGFEFASAIFTNFTGDHLDYHGNIENYLSAKIRLFESLSSGSKAILNRDDVHSDRIVTRTSAGIRWYGLSPAADLMARIEHIDGDGSVFVLISDGKEIRSRTSLIGRHNVYNCLAAIEACRTLGVSLADAAESLGRIPSVPGRLQRIETSAPFRVYIDYAHTDDALANAISSLRPVVPGRIIVVFGCGGDRDRTKRPRMGAVAQDLADVVVVTSDNPRTEQPDDIISDIVRGFEGGKSDVLIETDRRKAIAAAIDMARDDDGILIAGKGHEQEQVIGTEKVYFSDAEETLSLLKKWENQP